MTGNETGAIEVATEKAPEAREKTETIGEIGTATVAIETIVEDEMIATSDRIDHVLENEGTELIVKQDVEVSLLAREKIGMIVGDEMIEIKEEMIAIKDEIDAIGETLKWKDLARQDEMTAEVVIFIKIFYKLESKEIAAETATPVIPANTTAEIMTIAVMAVTTTVDSVVTVLHLTMVRIDFIF
jgi:hypothetical protein